jgi:hypothetical protein
MDTLLYSNEYLAFKKYTESDAWYHTLKKNLLEKKSKLYNLIFNTQKYRNS